MAGKKISWVVIDTDRQSTAAHHYMVTWTGPHIGGQATGTMLVGVSEPISMAMFGPLKTLVQGHLNNPDAIVIGFSKFA
jgi:hypothetical protein